MYELCALTPPFTATNQKLLAARIREGHVRRLPARYSANLQTVITSLLHTEVSTTLLHTEVSPPLCCTQR